MTNDYPVFVLYYQVLCSYDRSVFVTNDYPVFVLYCQLIEPALSIQVLLMCC